MKTQADNVNQVCLGLHGVYASLLVLLMAVIHINETAEWNLRSIWALILS